MHAAIIFSGTGPLVVLTSHDGLEDPELLKRLDAKGIRKFIGFPLPIELVRSKYGNHYGVVCEQLHETDDLRVLDFDGQRALKLLPFTEFGKPVYHESVPGKTLTT